MYADTQLLRHFGLNRAPFSRAPDPDFLYQCEASRTALKTIPEALKAPGSVAILLGETGLGKSSICQRLCLEIPDATLIEGSSPGVTGSLKSLRAQLSSIPKPSGSPSADREAKPEVLSADEPRQDQRCPVIVIDDAHCLSAEDWDDLAQLVSPEAPGKPAFSLALSGLPELNLLLPQQPAINTRVTIRCRFTAFSRKETREYLRHRIAVSGGPESIFSAPAMRLLRRHGNGQPLQLNTLANLALRQAYATRQSIVSKGIMRAVVKGLGITRRSSLTLILACLPLIALGVTWIWILKNPVLSLFPDEKIPAPPLPPVHQEAPPEQSEPPLGGSISDALYELFSSWNVPLLNLPLTSAEAACAKAQDLGLACLEGKADWAQIQAMNRPVTLEIEDEKTTNYLTVTSASITGVRSNSESAWILRSKLEKRWSGTFLLLWQMPPGYFGPLAIGAYGEATSWLRQKLQDSGYPTVAADPALFDQDLETALRRFQEAKALPSDGIAGPRTWIAINNQESELVYPKLDDTP